MLWSHPKLTKNDVFASSPSLHTCLPVIGHALVQCLFLEPRVPFAPLAIDLRLSLTPTARTAVLHLVRNASTELSMAGALQSNVTKVVAKKQRDKSGGEVRRK